ncbi:hypothetical protein [Planotetraspora silvatica]|nr:hypothetical protein [Planotetraspora silvatica]
MASLILSLIAFTGRRVRPITTQVTQTAVAEANRTAAPMPISR